MRLLSQDLRDDIAFYLWPTHRTHKLYARERDVTASLMTGSEVMYWVDEEPSRWLREHARGPWHQVMVAAVPIYRIFFARKADMAKFILSCCEK